MVILWCYLQKIKQKRYSPISNYFPTLLYFVVYIFIEFHDFYFTPSIYLHQTILYSFIFSSNMEISPSDYLKDLSHTVLYYVNTILEMNMNVASTDVASCWKYIYVEYALGTNSLSYCMTRKDSRVVSGTCNALFLNKRNS